MRNQTGRVQGWIGDFRPPAPALDVRQTQRHENLLDEAAGSSSSSDPRHPYLVVAGEQVWERATCFDFKITFKTC